MIRTARMYRTDKNTVCCDMYMGSTFYRIRQLYPHLKVETLWQLKSPYEMVLKRKK